MEQLATCIDCVIIAQDLPCWGRSRSFQTLIQVVHWFDDQHACASRLCSRLVWVQNCQQVVVGAALNVVFVEDLELHSLHAGYFAGSSPQQLAWRRPPSLELPILARIA